MSVVGDNGLSLRAIPSLMTFQHPGCFSLIDSGRRPAAIVLRRSPRGDEAAIEVVFARVTHHDLPTILDSIVVHESRSGERVYLVSSAGRDYRVHARSLRIHESTVIYGRALPLARFALHQRLLWTLLLWSARFAWGQALIRRIRGT